MKIKYLFSTAALALLLASCNGTGTDNAPSPATTPDISAKADSLVYCFGQMRGAEYVREAQRDTTLATDAAKQEYLRGVKAGLDAVKTGKEAYNKGLFQGIQMAMNINQFTEDYNVRLSDKVFMEGLSAAIKTDTVIDAPAMQGTFYKLMNEFNKAKEERDKEAALSALKAAGEALKMKSLSDQLWGTIPSGDAAKIKDGDRIKADIKITTLNGKDVNSPFPKELTVGQRLSNNPLSEAFKSLASGQTGTFITSAQALFGARAQQLGLKAADVLKLEVTPTIVEEKKAQ
ncbi:MAG: hypothetical protein K2L34_13835 [Muribaculaceae bacterium]|nr:hypothetical protein [Muribaculaceae bacterium]